MEIIGQGEERTCPNLLYGTESCCFALLEKINRHTAKRAMPVAGKAGAILLKLRKPEMSAVSYWTNDVFRWPEKGEFFKIFFYNISAKVTSH